MKFWRELPYRGDGEPRNKKPRRRFRNLKKERKEIIVTILIVLVIFAVPLLSILFDQSENSGDATKIAVLIFISFLVVLLIAGILSLYTFRKGYDIDISEEEIDGAKKSQTADNITD